MTSFDSITPVMSCLRSTRGFLVFCLAVYSLVHELAIAFSVRFFYLVSNQYLVHMGLTFSLACHSDREVASLSPAVLEILAMLKLAFRKSCN